MPGNLAIRECDAAGRAVWNAFVASCPDSNLSHRYEWKEICERAYGLRGVYLAAEAGGEIVAVFPAVRMPGFGPGRAVSVPFTTYGGMLAREGLDLERLLRGFLERLAREGMREVEVRTLLPDEGQAREVTMLLDLPGEEEALWASVGPKVRNQVRKAERSGVTARRGRDLVGELHTVYAENMGRLGTPAHPRRFFQACLDAFGEDADVLAAEAEGRVVGAMFLIRHAAVFSVPWASTIQQYNHLNPNMLMYWAALLRAVELGCGVFDFGRSSRDSGTHRFKKQWGAAPRALEYRTYVAGALAERSSLDIYRSPVARLVKEAWRRLPGWAQAACGPSIRKRMP